MIDHLSVVSIRSIGVVWRSVWIIRGILFLARGWNAGL